MDNSDVSSSSSGAAEARQLIHRGSFLPSLRIFYLHTSQTGIEDTETGPDTHHPHHSYHTIQLGTILILLHHCADTHSKAIMERAPLRDNILQIREATHAERETRE